MEFEDNIPVVIATTKLQQTAVNLCPREVKEENMIVGFLQSCGD